MRRRDRGTPGETRRRERICSGLRGGGEERTREWSEIVQLSASERKRVGAMCVGHVERACVLGSPVCLSLSLYLPPFPAVRPPCLSANVILQLSLSSLSLSLTLGRTTARQYLGPGYPALRTALRRAAFALSQPEGKLIPRCSDGNVTWRVSSTTRLPADTTMKKRRKTTKKHRRKKRSRPDSR